MKNRILKVMSALLAVMMVLTLFGCGKGGDDGVSTTDSKGNLVQPEVKNSTAVINYTSINNENKEVDATNIITSINEGSINYISTGSKLNQSLKDDEDKKDFVEKVEEQYEITDDEAQQIVDKAENWVEFTYIVYVSNTNAKAMKFRMLECNQSENVKVSKDLNCEYGLDPGKAMVIAIDGLVNLTALPTVEELEKELSTMKISIKCALVDGSCVKGTAQEIENWSTVKYSLMPITIKTGSAN